MTDLQTSRTGVLTVRPGSAFSAIQPDCIEVAVPGEVSVVVETFDLLGMIDAADPDAMRAYLRETAPEVIADLYRPEIPEADSPEDVDEHPEPVITVAPETLAAAEALGHVAAEIRAAFARGLAR